MVWEVWETVIGIVSSFGIVEYCSLRLESLEGRRVGEVVSCCRRREGFHCDCDYFFGLVSGFSRVNRLV